VFSDIHNEESTRVRDFFTAKLNQVKHSPGLSGQLPGAGRGSLGTYLIFLATPVTAGHCTVLITA